MLEIFLLHYYSEYGFNYEASSFLKILSELVLVEGILVLDLILLCEKWKSKLTSWNDDDKTDASAEKQKTDSFY